MDSPRVEARMAGKRMIEGPRTSDLAGGKKIGVVRKLDPSPHLSRHNSARNQAGRRDDYLSSAASAGKWGSEDAESRDLAKSRSIDNNIQKMAGAAKAAFAHKPVTGSEG